MEDMEVGTPEAVRRQYAAPPHETPEARRRRLANKRAAKYRALRSLQPERVEDQREKSSVRQRRRRQRLDEQTRARIREQNRQRQQLRRQRLNENERESIREAQRQRAQIKRSQLDEDTRNELRLRERERQRVQRRLHRETQAVRLHDLRQQEEEAGLRSRDDSQQGYGYEVHEQQAEEEEEDDEQQQLYPRHHHQTRLPQLRVATAPPHHSIPSLNDRTAVQLPSVSEARSATSASHRDKELPALHPPPRHTHTHHSHHPQPPRAPFSGIPFSLPPPPPSTPRSTSASSGLHKPFPDRVRPLPHLQVALPQASSLLHPPPPSRLMPAPPSGVSLTAPASSNSLTGSVPPPPSVSSHTLVASSRSLPMPQPPMAPIVLPPAHRSLPPLPDFLNSREVFDPASAAVSSSFFQLRGDQSRKDQASEYYNV